MEQRLRFDAYVDRCLYDPEQGFYASGRGVAGRRGDFITSPEVGPLFGAVLARALDAWWRELGCPDPYVVIDAGSGPGTLQRSLELAAPACAAAWQLRSIDIADRNRNGASGADQLGSLEGSVVIANELLDNLPFRVLERTDSGWSEVYVVAMAEELVDTEAPAWAEALSVEPGQRIPVHDRAVRWVESVLDGGAARLVVFDYGEPATETLARRGGWLRTYRAHERGDDPYREPGSWDITTDVGFDQLPAPDGLVRQAEFLSRWGIDVLVEQGREYWTAHAARPDVAAFRMRSRLNEAAALLDPRALGNWLVAEWS